MAEGFARTYGRDVIVPTSAGLSPAISVAPITHKIMLEKNIDLGSGYPKGLDTALAEGCDLIVNMSGLALPVQISIPVEEWNVRDPVLETEEVHRDIANEIEHLVMRLILKLRAKQSPKTKTRRTGFDTKRKTPRK